MEEDSSGVGGPVAEKSADGREYGEEWLLNRPRWAGEAEFSRIGPCDDCCLQEVRGSFAVGLLIPSEAAYGLEADRTSNEQQVAMARQRLKVRTWEQGRVLTIDEAVGYALGRKTAH